MIVVQEIRDKTYRDEHFEPVDGKVDEYIQSLRGSKSQALNIYDNFHDRFSRLN